MQSWILGSSEAGADLGPSGLGMGQIQRPWGYSPISRPKKICDHSLPCPDQILDPYGIRLTSQGCFKCKFVSFTNTCQSFAPLRLHFKSFYELHLLDPLGTFTRKCVIFLACFRPLILLIKQFQKQRGLDCSFRFSFSKSALFVIS